MKLFSFLVFIASSQLFAGDLDNSLLKERTRASLINYLIQSRGYTSYLEIGVDDGKNLATVKAVHKIGVDPALSSPCTHHMTSDEFFESNRETFDLIFIDGLHLREQVVRDVEHSLACLNDGGVIVMHDCMPKLRCHQERVSTGGSWTGDVWKAAAFIRTTMPDVHFCVLDMDWGCGIVTPHSHQTLYPSIPMNQLTWDYFQEHKKELLNIVSLEEWLKED